MSFLNLEHKKIVVFGLANKKSVACAIGRTLVDNGAEVIHVVRSEQRAATARKLFPHSPVYICDVAQEDNIIRRVDEVCRDISKPK